MSKGTGSATSQNAGMLVRDNCTGEVEKSESRACVSPATGWELGVTQTRVGASCGSGALNLDLVHCGVFDFMPFFVQEVGEVGGALLPVLRKDHSQLGVGLGKRLDASLFRRKAGGCHENVSIFRHHGHQGKVAAQEGRFLEWRIDRLSDNACASHGLARSVYEQVPVEPGSARLARANFKRNGK